MPPKSSSSKKSTVLWYFCENCKVSVTSRDKESHDKVCPIETDTSFTLSYIRNEVLFTTTVQIKSVVEELKDIPLKLQNNLIFISESALRLCRFVIGEHVVITSSENRNVVPLVRLVWPLPEKLLDTVYVSEEDFQTNWTQLKDVQLKIEKLHSDPIPAEFITLEYSNDNVLEKGTNDDLYKLLRVQLRNLVICKGHSIKMIFYNKLLSFTVTDIKYSKIDSTTEESLEIQLKALNLNEQDEICGFFLVTNRTKYEIAQNEDKEVMKDNSNQRITLNDIGGLDEVIEKIREPMNIALGFQQVPPGFKVGRGLLLFGHSGCGKTMLCEAISHELTNVEIIKINTNELFSKYFGETERNLQKEFERAYSRYPRPSLIVIEDLNNICPKHDTNDVVRRVSAAFLNILDNLHMNPMAGRTFVMATTSNIENLNATVRRCGRIDIEIEIAVPSPSARYNILKKYLDKVQHSLTDKEIRNIAAVTHAFVGSDLANLIAKAAVSALDSIPDSKIKIEHINTALNYIKPSAMREVLIENPNVQWDDIGGQKDLKLKLKQAIEWPLHYPDKFKELGIKPPRGILMFGPPGCSKTMIAKALATDSKVNFLSIKGPELFSMWVGESERAVRELFRKAREVAPAIIFFDEIDAIGGERSSDSGSSVKERVLAQMLTELDGIDSLNNVTIVAATNRPDLIDKALMRPGRIDRIVYVGLPDNETRREIFRIKLKVMPLGQDVNVEWLVQRTEGYSGAEIQAVCHEAALNALEETIEANQVEWRHFEHALALVQPRTSPSLLKLYDDYIKQS